VIADVARHEGRGLLTLDLDFSNIRAYPPAEYAGIVVLRPHTQDKNAVRDLLRRLIAVLANESPDAELWIVEPDRIRRRS
jgi:predicted nuclease of predicted toxin-antitoxin system